MTINIDDALARLAADAPHPGLAGLEARVLSAISVQPAASIGAGTAFMAMGLALTLGVFSNIVPAADAHAAPALSPLGAPSPLAPSSLLTEPR